MSTAQLAAVSFLARYSGRTHAPYTYQLKRWFGWCQTNGLDPLVGIQRAHLGLSIRGLGDSGLVESSVGTMMHGGARVLPVRAHRRADLSRPSRLRAAAEGCATRPAPRAWTAWSSIQFQNRTSVLCPDMRARFLGGFFTAGFLVASAVPGSVASAEGSMPGRATARSFVAAPTAAGLVTAGHPPLCWSGRSTSAPRRWSPEATREDRSPSRFRMVGCCSVGAAGATC